MAARALRPLGVVVPARQRSFIDDARYWRASPVRERIAEAIRRPGALAHGIWGEAAVGAVLDDWERAAEAPAQVIGALYVFEQYHRGLGAALSACRAFTAPDASPIPADP